MKTTVKFEVENSGAGQDLKRHDVAIRAIQNFIKWKLADVVYCNFICEKLMEKLSNFCREISPIFAKFFRDFPEDVINVSSQFHEIDDRSPFNCTHFNALKHISYGCFFALRSPFVCRSLACELKNRAITVNWITNIAARKVQITNVLRLTIYWQVTMIRPLPAVVCFYSRVKRTEG